MKQIDKDRFKSLNRRVMTGARIAATVCCILIACTSIVFAGDGAGAGGGGGDTATTAIDNFTTIICNIVTAIGVIVTIFGIVQIAMSVPSHDTSQRTQGFLALAGGIIMAVAPQIASSVLEGTDAAGHLPTT